MEATVAINKKERKRVEVVVETLADLHSQGESLSEVAHDARNMVTALGLYCDLLQEPGVLAGPFKHYGDELRLVAAASRRLVEKLVSLDNPIAADDTALGLAPSEAETTVAGGRSIDGPVTDGPVLGGPAVDGIDEPRSWASMPVNRVAQSSEPDQESEQKASLELGRGLNQSLDRSLDLRRHWDTMPSEPIKNLAAELLANRNLLTALSGPGIVLTVDTVGGALPVRLTAEDLTRVLVNLIKNAAEAMPAGGRIQIGLSEIGLGGRPGAAVTSPRLGLTIEDNGPGIPADALEKIFASGYTTRSSGPAANGGWPSVHRGLGLAISRSIVEASGGRMTASNRAEGGTRITIELPVEKARRLSISPIGAE
jgi:signal transduction histidine kinase